jgi:hypothetical protein
VGFTSFQSVGFDTVVTVIPPDVKLVKSTPVHRGVGTEEAYSGRCFAALMKERRENGVRVENIVKLQVGNLKRMGFLYSNHYDNSITYFKKSPLRTPLPSKK